MLFLIWADEKYSTQKIPVLFSRPKKIPFGQNVRPKKILRTPPSLKYVSGAPGVTVRASGHKIPFPGFYEHDAQLLS